MDELIYGKKFLIIKMNIIIELIIHINNIKIKFNSNIPF